MKISDYPSVSSNYPNTKREIIKTPFSTDKCNGNSLNSTDYYQNLCKNYPNITFRLEDKAAAAGKVGQCCLGYNNSMNQIGNNFGKQGQCSISLDISVIEKMQNDPEYEQRIKGMIENSCDRYSEYESNALADGYSYVSILIEDEGGQPIRGIMESNIPYSTEEQVKAMWSDDKLTEKLKIKFENGKRTLLDSYLEMLEKSDRSKLKLDIQEQSL